MDKTRAGYFAEVSRELRQKGLTSLTSQDGLMTVERDGQELCKVTSDGGIRYRQELREDPQTVRLLDKIVDIVSTVDEYTKRMEAALPLEATGLEDRFKLLADFNDRVLAGTMTEFGTQFVTWEWSYDRTGVGSGHYFTGVTGYQAAKQDFAVRAGLVPKCRMFSDKQMTEIYRCVSETLENDQGYPMSAEREKLLETTVDQIERAVPDLYLLVDQSNQQELEVGNGPMSGMAQM